MKGSSTGSAAAGVFGGKGIFAVSNLQVSDASPERGTAITVSATVTNSGPVSDSATVTLKVDGVTVAYQVVTVAAGGTATASFEWVPTDTAAHQVTIGDVTASSVQATAPAVAGVETTVAIGTAVVLLVAGLLVGWFIGGRRKPPGARPPSKEEPTERSSEEELPPEI